nr:FAD-dependent oxidoreductase [Roseovarius sp. A-2]
MEGYDGVKELWKASARNSFSANVLNADMDCDVAVIGGGYTGCSTALHGAELGLDVTLLEASTLGAGCSGRNSGNLNPGLWLTKEEICARLGENSGNKLNSLLSNGPTEVRKLVEKHNIDCEFNASGTFHCARDGRGLSELQARAESQRLQGMDVQVLGADETKRHLGTEYFQSCLWNRDAASIQPLAYLRGLAQAATRHGARIFENSPATKIERSGTQWLVHTPRGTLTAQALVVATDAYHRDTRFGSINPMWRLWYFNCATDPLSKDYDHILPSRQGCWDTGRVMTSFTRDVDGRFIIGSVGKLDSILSGIHLRWLKRRSIELFPELGPVPLEFSWHGSMGMTPDQLPRLVDLGPRAIGSYGYSGRGIAPGTMFGQAIANYLHTDDPDMLPLKLSQTRYSVLKKFREPFYEMGALAWHLIGARSTGAAL